MTVEKTIGYFTRTELLALLGIANADDPKLAAIADLSWGGNALKVLRVNATENGWEFSTITGYTDEQAQDAVGSILTDSASIDFTYDDGAGTITAAVKADSVGNTLLANMAEATIKGRASGAGTGDPADLTPTEVLTILGGTTGTGSIVRSVSPALTGTATAGTIAATRVHASNAIRTTGFTVDAGWTGPGLEFGYSTGLTAAFFQGWNRTTNTGIPVHFYASTVSVYPGAVLGATFSSTGMSVVGSLKPSSYTVATVPSAVSHGAGATIYVSNESGGAVLAFSDAINWRRVTDLAIIS